MKHYKVGDLLVYKKDVVLYIYKIDYEHKLPIKCVWYSERQGLWHEIDYHPSVIKGRLWKHYPVKIVK